MQHRILENGPLVLQYLHDSECEIQLQIISLSLFLGKVLIAGSSGIIFSIFRKNPLKMFCVLDN